MGPTTRRFVANRGALAGLVLAALLVACAIAAPLLSSADPIAADVDHGLTAHGAPLGPSAHAPLGTDQLGRDVWARLLAGAGASLSTAAIATLIALVIGLAIGLTAGYAGGWIDEALMRFVDLFLAFPFLLLAILFAALLREADLASANAPVYVTLGLVGWTTLARAVRAKTRSLAQSGMIAAARGIGASPARIVVRHLLPNVAGLTVAVTTLAFAQNVLAESVLSYIGLGAPPPAPTWGRMLFDARAFYRTSPHLVIAPSIAIVLAVVAFQLLGDGLRDAVEPKERA
ncbi:MAG TPA: ABC transporter permease [Kofleriaceae bacterium]